MAQDFPIELKLGAFTRLFLYSQFFCTPPLPTKSFAGQTVIVTGANVGLGLEAARHFYRLNCAKLILAVRTVSKGESAKEDIVRSVKHRSDADAIEFRALDLSSTASTIAFAEGVKKDLPRIDVVVENAGINTKTYTTMEGIEQTMQINVLNTFLLGLLILPKLADTAKLADSNPHLTVVTSEAHHLNKFTQINESDIFESMNDETTYNGQSSYEISKLMQILFVRELVLRLGAKNALAPSIIVNAVNPGLCVSTLATRNKKSLAVRSIEAVVYALISRSTEAGSRTLVLGASADGTSHGEYMSDGKNQDVEEWIYTDVGKRAQKKVFEQTLRLLELRKPGLGAAVGL